MHAALRVPAAASASVSIAAACITVGATLAAGRAAAASECTYAVHPNTVSVVDRATGFRTAIIPVGERPIRLVLRPDGTRAYVTSIDAAPSGGVVVIDTATNEVSETILAGTQPVDIAFSPDGARMYVVTGYSAAATGSVLVVDAATYDILDRIPSPGAGRDRVIAVHPSGAVAYVTSPDSNTVSAIDLVHDAVIAVLHLGDTPLQLSFSADGTLVYVPTAGRNSLGGLSFQALHLVEVDVATNTIVATVRARQDDVTEYKSDDRTIVIPVRDHSTTASVPAGCWGGIATPTPTATWTPTPTRTPTFTRAPTRPRVPTPTPNGTQTPMTAWEYVYVANEGADIVSVVDAATDAVVATIPVGTRPRSLAMQPDGSLVYVAGPLDVSLIDTAGNVVVATIPIPYDDPETHWWGRRRLSPDMVVPSPDGAVAYVVGTYLSGFMNDYRWSSVLATIDPASRSVTSTTKLASSCAPALAVAPDGRTLYVAQSNACRFWESSDPHVSVVALAADTVAVTGSVDVAGERPLSLKISPDGTRLYLVENNMDGGASLVVLDAGTLEVVGSVALDAASDLAFARDAARIYVRTPTGLVVVDPTTLAVSVAIPTGSETGGLALSRDGRRAYVTDAASYSLSIVDTATDTVAANVPMRAKPRGIAVAAFDHPLATPTPTPAAGPSQVCAYTTLYEGGVAIVNTDTKRVTGDIALTGRQIVLTPDDALAYVPRWEWNDIAVIDTRAHAAVAEIPLGGAPKLLALSPDGRFGYAPVYQRDIAVIDLVDRSVVATIPTDGYIYAVAVTHAGLAYATTQVCADTCRTVLLVIDTAAQRVVGSIDVGSWSTEDLLALSPDDTRLYGMTFTSGVGFSLAMLDTANGTVVGTVPLADRAWGLAVHPDGHAVYLIEEQVTVIDPTAGRVVTTLPVTGYDMAFTPDGVYAYLGGRRPDGSGVLSIIDTRSNTVVDDISMDGMPLGIAIGTVPGGCVDPYALTPRPTYTPTDTPRPTYTPAATRTATPTRTRTPTRTPTIPAAIIVGSAHGSPGARVTVAVRLRAAGRAVAGTQNDIGFDRRVPIAAKANGRPDCAVNPAIDKPATTFGFLPAGCTPGANCARVRALVFAADDLDPIADGAVLYTCAVNLPRGMPAGTYPLRVTNLAVGGTRGQTVPAIGIDGEIVVTPSNVQPPACAPDCCAGDCDGSGDVEVAELLRIVSIATGAGALPECPVADLNGDGEVMVDETLRAVNSALTGCPR